MKRSIKNGKVSGREIALRCEEKITEVEMKTRVNDRKMGKIHEKLDLFLNFKKGLRK